MTLTYRDAGVDIAAGDAFVQAIAPLAKKTHRPEVIGSLGGFSGLFRFDPTRYQEPLLVAATDGVGTKLKLAFVLDRHNTVGIDLVAMCVNDLVVCGAEPLFFLDYFATSKLDLQSGQAVVAGIAQGCQEAGCALLGGETAEMPGFYAKGEYDLAGFAVGVVDRSKMLGADRIKSSDQLVGLASKGIHSNGFSMVRKVLGLDQATPDTHNMLSDLLTPTQLYVKPCLDLMRRFDLHALAHITGGGLPANLPRVLPDGLAIELDWGSWPVPAVFTKIQSLGKIDSAEMLNTYNMGIGMVAIAPKECVQDIVGCIKEHGIDAWPIGRITESKNGQRFVLLNPPV